MSFIITHSGRRVEILNPKPEDIVIEDIVYHLAHINRFTGGVGNYSVAQHSIHVMGLVPQHLRLRALLHDAAEAYVGDLSAPLKELCLVYREIEKRFERVIEERFCLPPDPEGLVKQADTVMLATERRDLLPPHTDEWPVLIGVLPRPEQIILWKDSGYIFREFMDWFYKGKFWQWQRLTVLTEEG